MINLVQSDAEIITTEYYDLDFGKVVEQSEDSITVQFTNLNSFGQRRFQYAFPAAFEEGLIYVKGEANDILLQDIELNKQLKAIDVSLKALDLSDDDPVYVSLMTKRHQLEGEVAKGQRKFNEAVQSSEIAQYRGYVKRDEFELAKDLLGLACRITSVKKRREALDSYSGWKRRREYKELYTRFENALDSARTWVSSVQRTEKRLKSVHEHIGEKYELKYSSLNADTSWHLMDTCDQIIKDYTVYSFKNMVIIIPPQFSVVEVDDVHISFTTDQNCKADFYLEENKNIEEIENNTNVKAKEIARYDGSSTIKYIQGIDDNKCYYYQDEIYPESHYSLDIVKCIDIETDQETAEHEISQAEDLIRSGMDYYVL